MLAVDLLVHVDRAGPGVGVVAGDDVASAVADQIQRLFDRARRSGRFDGDVDAEAAGEVAHDLRALALLRALNVDDMIGAHGGRELEAIGWRAERDDARGAGQSRERDGAETDGAGPLHEHACRRGSAPRDRSACTAVISPQPPLM